MAELALRGRGEIISLYALEQDCEIDTSSYDLYSLADQEALYSRVEELVESGEIDAMMPSMQKRILFRDEAVVAIDEQEYSFDDLLLNGENLEEFLNLLEKQEENMVFYIQRVVGEGEFIFESEEEELLRDKVVLKYIDCNSYRERFNLVQEDILETICDSIDIDSIDVDGNKLSESEGYFDPTVTIDELYIAKYNDVEGIYLLERLDVGGERVTSTDYYVDDFDKN